MQLPRAVVPASAILLLGVGYWLVPVGPDGAPSRQLAAAATLLTLPGEPQTCATDLADGRCALTELAPRAAAREVEKQAHDLGLHDQDVSCVPKAPDAGQPQRCVLTVRDGRHVLELVTSGKAGGDTVTLVLKAAQ